MCNFALGFAGKVQAEDAAGTTVVALTGVRMGFIGIKQLLQAIFIFVTGFTFGGKLPGFVVDGLVNDCDVLAVVDDVKGGKLGVVVRDDVELALILALAQSTVALDEEAGEVLDVVVLCVLTEFEAGVLEEILVEDASVDQGSLDFGLVGEVEGFEFFCIHIDCILEVYIDFLYKPMSIFSRFLYKLRFLLAFFIQAKNDLYKNQVGLYKNCGDLYKK